LCKPIDVDELKLLLRRCVYVSDLEKRYVRCSRICARIFSKHARDQSANARRVCLHSQSGDHERAGAVARRKRDRKGDGCFSDPSVQFAKNGAFIAINCNSIPENLLESELFGMKGCVHRAHIQRKGLIENSAEGTLFLTRSVNCRSDPSQALALSSGPAVSTCRRQTGDPD